jgi:hypothetical protein
VAASTANHELGSACSAASSSATTIVSTPRASVVHAQTAPPPACAAPR